MTGSVFRRQVSSTASYYNVDKTIRPKQLRRCSSADEHNIIEVISKHNRSKKDLLIKFDPTTSDSDSGIEDICQQIVKPVAVQSNDMHKTESSSTLFAPCDDQKSETSSAGIIHEQLQNSETDFGPSYHRNLIKMASTIPDNEKKNFCTNTCEIFHGEFACLIAYAIASRYPNYRYYLFAEGELDIDINRYSNSSYLKLDNAKAQFKCPNIKCCRSWTSMRARISFVFSSPQINGFVILKIYGQRCQSCETFTNALWYPEEVCRVMKNLQQSMFATLFPEMVTYKDSQGGQGIQNLNTAVKFAYHDSNQRRGKMHRSHDKNHCEACSRGLCFA